MAYGLIITETATAVVAKMDPETHDRFVHAILEPTTDPHSQGQAISNDGPTAAERATALGASGLIVYAVDDVAATVRIVNVIWVD